MKRNTKPETLIKVLQNISILKHSTAEYPSSDEVIKFYTNIKPISNSMPNLNDKAFFKPVEASL